MPTADELLANLATHTHRVTDSDTHYIIDPITRQLDNATSFKNVLMQFDHDSERFTFEIPRFVEGHDMLLCTAVKVHYNNIDVDGRLEYPDVYDVTDLRVDPKDNTKAICSWLISRSATQYAGSLNFLVQYMCVEDGEVVYEWHTDIYSNVEIRAGRNNGEAAVIEYTDLLEQWRTRLFGEKDSLLADIQAESAAQIAEIQAKTAEAIESIPEDYAEVENMADEALRKKSDALTLTKSGEPIVLTDSSDNNLVGLKVFGRSTQTVTTGKNLFNNTADNQTVNGITFAVNEDGTVTASGTATANIYLSLGWINLPIGEYIINGCNGGGNTTYLLYSQKSGGEGYFAIKNGDVRFAIEDSDPRQILIAVYNGTTLRNQVFKPMVRLYGIEDDTYESYSGGVPSPSPDWSQPINHIINPTISIYGKNLLGTSPKTETNFGITYTINNDGVIRAVGTTPDDRDSNCYIVSNHNPIRLPKGDYYLSGAVGGTRADYRLLVYKTGWELLATCVDGPVLFTLEEDANIFAYVWIAKAHTVDMEFHPMIYPATSSTPEYEPYEAPQVIVLNHTIRGIPVSQNGNYTDANGQQWICDEIDFERGKFIQRVKEVVLSDLKADTWYTWGVNHLTQGITGFYHYVNESYQLGVNLCTIGIPSSYAWGGGGTGTWVNANAQEPYITISVNNEYLSDVTSDSAAVASFVSLIQTIGATMLVALETPIETDLTAVEMEAFRALHTNATSTTILNNQNAHMQVKYNADLYEYIMQNVTMKSTKFDITLTKAGWVQSSDHMYHTQAVNYTAGPNGKVDLHPTPEQLISLINDGISMFVANENGVVTAYSIGGIPGTDMTIRAVETVVVYT